MYQVLISNGETTRVLSESLTRLHDAIDHLLSEASERIWNFDEYTQADIERITEDGEARFGIHHLYISEI